MNNSVGFYNYIVGPNPLADWVPRGSIFASGGSKSANEFGPGGPNWGGGPNLLGHRPKDLLDNGQISEIFRIVTLVCLRLCFLCFKIRSSSYLFTQPTRASLILRGKYGRGKF